MPTYEYQCPAGHQFEKLQKITEKPRAKCPACGKPATRKISAGAGLLFKGTGFYITDYGKDGKGPRKPEAEKSSVESKPATSPKTDGKPGTGTGASTGAETAKPKSPKAASE